MSMTLNLEIADGINLEQVAQALSSISEAEITNNGSLLEAYFPHSNGSVSAKSDLIDTAILTEELENAGWKVGMRIYLDIDPTLPNSLTEIKEFIIALSKLTEVPFALSFGYETLYAKRMEGGIEFNDEML